MQTLALLKDLKKKSYNDNFYKNEEILKFERIGVMRGRQIGKILKFFDLIQKYVKNKNK